MMIARIGLALLLLCGPAVAATVPVPADCVELARREGFPTDVLTDKEQRQARIRMMWLRVRHPFDPLVKRCRAAIHQ